MVIIFDYRTLQYRNTVSEIGWIRSDTRFGNSPVSIYLIGTDNTYMFEICRAVALMVHIMEICAQGAGATRSVVAYIDGAPRAFGHSQVRSSVEDGTS